MRIPYEEMESRFYKLLIKYGFETNKAEQCALIFTRNSLDGIYTHGVNRFARFVEYISKGYVKPDREAAKKSGSGAIEQWDGHLGPGPVNAMICVERAMELAREFGMGCVGLANTNHWMRGGYYGWEAARKGFIFMGWSNTIANMPAWGAVDCKLGNNPLVIAAPYGSEAVTLDMAMSQFSYGSMEAAKLKGKPLPFPGGYDQDGRLTTDPALVLESKRALAAGYWKGAGLALALDILAAAISGGLSTSQISQKEAEYGVSQVYIAIDGARLAHFRQTIDAVIQDYRQSTPDPASAEVRYPGERIIKTRRENLARGIPVNEKVWQEILSL